MKRLVFLNGKEEDSPAKKPKQGDTVSVRGYGRFIYTGSPTTSKKGKLNAELEIYV
jgi:RNA-binding protein YlmH